MCLDFNLIAVTYSIYDIDIDKELLRVKCNMTAVHTLVLPHKVAIVKVALSSFVFKLH